MKFLVLDNYDSFTYNLVYLLRQLGIEPNVLRNDKLTPAEALNYDGILLSPGPGLPEEGGQMPAIVKQCAGRVPILGICLGHQAIAQFLGGELVQRERVFHGIQSSVRVLKSDSILFDQQPSVVDVGRYHSWEVDQASLSEKASITAVDEAGSVMALEAPDLKLFGLQFHPESVLTPNGPAILKNFLRTCQSTAA